MPSFPMSETNHWPIFWRSSRLSQYRGEEPLNCIVSLEPFYILAFTKAFLQLEPHQPMGTSFWWKICFRSRRTNVAWGAEGSRPIHELPPSCTKTIVKRGSRHVPSDVDFNNLKIRQNWRRVSLASKIMPATTFYSWCPRSWGVKKM